jgi:uncharacterized protein (TIGR02246 family)
MAEPTDGQLAARIAVLRDRIAIRELTARYNHAVDDCDPEQYAATWTEDGEFWRDGQLTKGRAAIADISRRAGFSMVHMTFDPIVEIDGDTATQRCYAIVGARQPDRAPGSSKWVTSGSYVDTLVRTPDGWLFAKRVWWKDAIVEGRPEWAHPR